MIDIGALLAGYALGRIRPLHRLLMRPAPKDPPGDAMRYVPDLEGGQIAVFDPNRKRDGP